MIAVSAKEALRAYKQGDSAAYKGQLVALAGSLCLLDEAWHLEHREFLHRMFGACEPQELAKEKVAAACALGLAGSYEALSAVESVKKLAHGFVERADMAALLVVAEQPKPPGPPPRRPVLVVSGGKPV